MSLVNRSIHIPRWFLLITALATGAVVMALEIVGSRLLAPVFGNSLFVWGALIGVILAAMSSGYAFGGWVSDRYPGAQVLARLLLFSGAWTFLIAWLGQPVLFRVATAIEDPRWGPCVAVALLLGPPAFGLSGVLPAMLRLAVSDFEHFGRHTGRMIALSTVGSLADGVLLSVMDRQPGACRVARRYSSRAWSLVVGQGDDRTAAGDRNTHPLHWRVGSRRLVPDPDVAGAGLSGRQPVPASTNSR
jgi:MFS family permease